MEKLKIDFEIPKILEDDIDSLVRAVNVEKIGIDCWQEEIRTDLKCCEGVLTPEQIDLLMEYYYVREWMTFD